MLIGYARVSTPSQSLNLQIKALKEAGCEEIFTDIASGAKVARPGLKNAEMVLRKGDALNLKGSEPFNSLTPFNCF